MGFGNPFMKPEWWGPLQKSLEAYDFDPGVLRAIQHGNALRLFPKVEKLENCDRATLTSPKIRHRVLS